ncbi:ATP-binding protein [Streptomyces sp.]|uniref:ATP-binding protein n=1 Tax=Streptomyces sp. TaxID=1931 RepID=UPI002D428ED2|nr:ATP-binding protein [Streptomyces sp.]HZF90449.1 ATP-binding protein [Streptomyces sp.]
MSYRLTAPSLATTPKIARDWVALVLRTANLPRLVEPARVCTSEVVTNAHWHSRTSLITVEVTLAHRQTTVLVRDNNPNELPLLVPADRYARDEHGRGLLLVDSLAADWNVRILGDHAKAVYFTLIDHEGSAAA